ncbi:MAG: heparinase II/III family protein [Butyrivibrio sp.]|nr:heparinase II/III family protein [Butyrivibrio sp.]
MTGRQHSTLIEELLLSATAGGAFCPPQDCLRESLPDIRNRDFWDGLDVALRKELIEEGVRQQALPWSTILLSDYRAFCRTGDRAAFEEKQFSRRIKLSALVMAECTEHQGRFLDDILDGMYLIMGEDSWCLPAHNSYERDHPQEPLPDVTRPVVDLFAAESAAVLATAEYLLRAPLSEVSPFVSRAVDAALEKRVLLPYLQNHFWWMGDGRQPMCNWTVWITQNILLTVLTRTERLRTGQELLRQAARSVDFFLDEYAPDGCCDEGAQYYGHAGLCLWGCLTLLDAATAGGMAAACQDERIRNIAAYIVRVHVAGEYYVNYADCAAKPGRRSAREYLFGRDCRLPALQVLAAQDYLEESWPERLLTSEHNLWYRVLQAGAHQALLLMARESENTESKVSKVSPGSDAAPGDFYFESTGLMVARDAHWFLAAKAGDNGDSHNHNDVGSVIVYRDGRPVLIDLGVETYTARTFSVRRYEIWTMQSCYHNLPSFLDGENLIQQRDGEQYAAASVSCRLEDTSCALSMDLAGAYPDDRIRHYTRCATLTKGTGIRISDRYEGEPACVLSLLTCEKPRLLEEKDGVLEIGIGGLCRMSVEGTAPGGMRIETLPIKDERLKQSWSHDCYRILLPMAEDILAVTLA